VDAAPLQPANESLTALDSAAVDSIHATLFAELWRECGVAEWGLGRDDFDRILVAAAVTQNFGLASAAVALPDQQKAFFRGLRLPDLALAKTCAEGNERAWEHFVQLYGQQLTRAAIAISGNETVGRDLADAFYAELYGLSERDGRRRCPLDSYRGRGSLLGWLRTTLAQRYVDHYRKSFREQSLADDVEIASPAPDPALEISAISSGPLAQAIEQSLGSQPPEEQFLMAAYYLDERTLAQIASLLGVHEATISRRLRRATDAVRKEVLRNLQRSGMSRRAAEEALGTDPRDLDVKMDLKKLMQFSLPDSFTERTPSSEEVTKTPFANDSLSNQDKLTDNTKAAG
jgi:RNA polymerase sigma-70 factor, ECF subfamily